jgi:hypothetical protein
MSSLTIGLIALVLCLILHLVEEILTGFREKLPLGELPLWLFVGINLLIYSFAAVMTWRSITEKPGALLMSWLFAIGMLGNGLGHLGIMVVRKTIFQGELQGFYYLQVRSM